MNRSKIKRRKLVRNPESHAKSALDHLNRRPQLAQSGEADARSDHRDSLPTLANLSRDVVVLRIKIEKLEGLVGKFGANAPSTAPVSAAPAPPLNLNEFCKRQGISRSTFYTLLRAGQAPRHRKIMGRYQISLQAEAEWVEKMEGQTPRSSGFDQ